VYSLVHLQLVVHCDVCFKDESRALLRVFTISTNWVVLRPHRAGRVGIKEAKQQRNKQDQQAHGHKRVARQVALHIRQGAIAPAAAGRVAVARSWWRGAFQPLADAPWLL